MTKKTAETETVASEVAAAPGPQLNITDIQSAIAAIDYACEQGAYKGWQVVTNVFQTREKLAAFVQSVTVPVSPGEEA